LPRLRQASPLHPLGGRHGLPRSRRLLPEIAGQTISGRPPRLLTFPWAPNNHSQQSTQPRSLFHVTASSSSSSPIPNPQPPPTSHVQHRPRPVTRCQPTRQNPGPPTVAYRGPHQRAGPTQHRQCHGFIARVPVGRRRLCRCYKKAPLRLLLFFSALAPSKSPPLASRFARPRLALGPRYFLPLASPSVPS
jgi:hypothetical protein